MRILKWVGGLIYSYCFSLHGALTLSLILLLQFFLYFVNKICEWSWFWTGFKKKQNHTNSHVYRYQSAVSSHLTACYIPKHFKWVLSKFEKVIITQVTSVPPPPPPSPCRNITPVHDFIFCFCSCVFSHVLIWLQPIYPLYYILNRWNPRKENNSLRGKKAMKGLTLDIFIFFLTWKGKKSQTLMRCVSLSQYWSSLKSLQ